MPRDPDERTKALELAPCRICRGPASTEEAQKLSTHYSVFCDKCRATPTSGPLEFVTSLVSMDEAMRGWNVMRTPPPDDERR